MSDTPNYQELLERSLATIKTLRRKVQQLEAARTEPVAVIGIGCRFPGGADSPQAYWDLLRRGVDAIAEIPAERWDSGFYYDPDFDAAGKICTRQGGFLRNRDGFDPQFFKISPREATYLDPQQRLLLEVAWEALEHANIPPEKVYGSDGGVFVGISGFDYANLISEYLPEEEIDPTVGTGSGHSPASGRLSYFLGWQGPSISLDTACSSSLVAVHAACESLRRGECRMALAGGVNMILSPFNHIVFSRARMLSPDGRSKAFADSADGYGRSEGAGLLVLKRLSDALRERDRVLAVIRGGAVNQDGPSGGLTVPNGPAQQEVIRRALAAAALTPEDVDYIEAHGTGTALGDPIEMNALAAVFRKSHSTSRPLWVGSAKTNLGHMESAAGIGGLIKVILQLQHRMIAPHLHFQHPSTRIPWEQLPVHIPTCLADWPTVNGKRRMAGVSSFGFSGTNAHIILEEAPELPAAPPEFARSRHIFTLSAKTPQALNDLAESCAAAIAERPEAALSDFCYASKSGRSHFHHRAALVVASHADLIDKLSVVRRGEPDRSVFRDSISADQALKVAFLFTGQGSQYAGMARELYETQPLVREVLEHCDAILRSESDYSLLDVLYSGRDTQVVNQTGYSQPLLFAVECALARLWQSWGIQPAAVMGHSVGEYAAASVAGVFSLEDGLKLIAARGRLMQSLPAGGGMLAIQAPLEAVRERIAICSSLVSIAAHNSPRSVVISGPRHELVEIAARCSRERIPSKELDVSHAFHSPLMNPMLDDFAFAAGSIRYSEAAIDIISNVTGECANDQVARAEYWVRHITAPVRFRDGLDTLAKLGCSAVIEIGPKPTLIDLGRASIGGDRLWLASLRPGRGDWDQMFHSLAQLYVSGFSMDWEAVDKGYASGKATLPTYQFQRERYWFAPHVLQKKIAPAQAVSKHLLLGRRISGPDAGGHQIVFESKLVGSSLAYLMDHRVLGTPVFPAAGYLEMALAAGRFVLGELAVVRGVELQRPLVLSEDAPAILRVIVEHQADDHSVRILSRNADAANDSSGWILHAQATLTAHSEDAAPMPDWNSLRPEIPLCQDTAPFYAAVKQRGLDYGANFRTIREIGCSGGRAIGRITLPENLNGQEQAYCVHPALLDGAFQLLGAALDQQSGGDAYLPVAIGSLCSMGKPAREYWAHAEIHIPLDPNSRIVAADVTLYDGDQQPAVFVNALRLVRTSPQALAQALEQDPSDLLYQVNWRRKPLPSAMAQQPPNGRVLIFTDSAGLGRSVSRDLSEHGCESVIVRNAAEPRSGIEEDQEYVLASHSRDEFLKLLDSVRDVHFHSVLYFWGLDTPGTATDEEIDLHAAGLLGCDALLKLIQALSARSSFSSTHLFVFTRGACGVRPGMPVRMEQAAVSGLARVILLEYPALSCTQIDLDQKAATALETSQIVTEVLAGDSEEQVAWRSGLRFCPQLGPALAARSTSSSKPVQVAIEEYGAFENLALRSMERRPPGPGEVEIAVEAAALNFKDVLHVLGMLKQHALEMGQDWVDRRTLGFECAGTVVRTGEGVIGLKAGDPVIGFGSECVAGYVCLPHGAVIAKPPNVGFGEASAIPTAFLTAWHALYTLAKIRPSDKVLIHAGAGSVGQAAIQLCRRIGAEVFATASPGKWDFLKSQGVSNVMNSRNTDYRSQIRELTNGSGVDVVLNSLGGEFIPANLDVLAHGGRFVEIGKLGIWTPEQMAAARPDISYFTFELSEATAALSSGFKPVLDEVTRWMAEGSVEPLPVEEFPISEVSDAFRHLAQGRNVGKVVIRFASESAGPAKPAIDALGTYWITGGCGALGLKVAEWLVHQGARQLVLTSRTGPDQEANLTIARLRERGARVEALAASVNQRSEVARVLEHIDSALPPLKGIIHAAGIVDDNLLEHQTAERFEAVMAPKITGTWNLHSLTLGRRLDFFVCFSSLSAVLGSPGQGNYAAANSYMDALMAHRRSLGLPGSAIDWGPWASVGMAARLNRNLRDQMIGKGVHPIAVGRALAAFDRVLRLTAHQIIVAEIDWSKFARQFRAGSLPRLLAGLVKSGGETPEHAVGTDGFLAKLTGAPAPQRPALLSGFVRKVLATTLRLPSGEAIGLSQPWGDFGLDSLTAVEVRNLLSATLERDLSSTLLFDYPTINALTAHLLELLFPQTSAYAANGREAGIDSGVDSILASVEAMPEAAAARQLGRLAAGAHLAAGPLLDPVL